MLRNMKVGTKLLAVVLPPLLVLVVVAGIGARDRLAEAADARTAEEYIDVAMASGQVMAALQTERTLSVLSVVGAEAEGLDAARSATDTAVGQLGPVVDGVDASSVVGEAAVLFQDRLEDLRTIRASVDRGGVDPLIIHQWFVDSIDRHIDVTVAVSNEVPFPEVSADLQTLVALTRAMESAGQVQTAMAIGVANDQFNVDGHQWRALLAGSNSQKQYLDLFFAIATPPQQAQLRGLLSSRGDVEIDGTSLGTTDVEAFRLAVAESMIPHIDWLNSGEDLDGTPNRISTELARTETPDNLRLVAESPAHWVAISDLQLDAFQEVGSGMFGDITTTVGDARSETEQQALFYLLVTAAAVLVSAILALVVARRITKPLRNLTEAADRLSTEQLPALVERLKSPGSESERILLEPINMNRTDEIGHLADAFDAIQRVTVDVAEEQANLLKKGIGDIFVNLARRNQTLLDRQIEFIDQLESQEEDPDVLEDLFKLDHLATRMRRNAESLLVLAGIETGHRRSRPVALADVVRVAIGEVEDFARLNLVAMDDAIVAGSAAMDVAHLLSELMENATSFSPPETHVEILGHQNADGSYVLSISDQGIGMSDEQFAETNKLLAEPPLVGLTLSRSLGFTVVGRLAARFGIDVRLTSSPTGGVTALVTLPRTILESSTISVEPEAGPAAESAPVEPEVAPASFAPSSFADAPSFVDEPSYAEPSFGEPSFEAPSFEPEPAVADSFASDSFGSDSFDRRTDEAPAAEWVPDAPLPSTLATAVPEGAAFDAGLAALMGEEAPATPAEEPTDQPAPLFGAAEPATEPGSEQAPVRTAAGLVKRVPRSSAAATPEPRPSGEAPVARTQRSPEEVRAMLSRYRSGLHRGRDVESPSGDGSN